MSGLRQFLCSNRMLCAAIVAATLLLRAMIPGGMMPAVNSAGALSVVICNGQGDAARIDLPLPDKPVAPTDHPCPYLALAHALLAPPPILPVAPTHTPIARQANLTEPAVTPASPSFLRPPARAPPGNA